EHAQPPLLRLGANRLRYSVGAEDDGAASGDLGELLDEHRALALQVVDDVLVVHDLVAHVDRGAVHRERLLDDADRALDAGAETAGVGEQDFHDRILGFLRGAGRPKAVEDQQPGPHGNRGIGEVERPEVPAERVKVEEIHDVPESDAIPQVAERAAKDQREACGEQPLARMPREHHDDERRRSDRDADEEQPLPAPGVGEEAERRAAVVSEDKVEESGDLADLAEAQAGADCALAHLVRYHDERRDHEPGRDALQGRHAKRRGSPAPNRFDTQRPQISGCLASAPTSARQCQQRAHFGCLLGAARIASGPDETSAREVISTKRSSSPSVRSSASLSPLAAMSTPAWSGEPISPASRCFSRTFCTSERNARNALHFAINASPSGISGNRYAVCANTVSAPGWNTFHASSAVKLRTGVIQRRSAWTMW